MPLNSLKTVYLMLVKELTRFYLMHDIEKKNDRIYFIGQTTRHFYTSINMKSSVLIMRGREGGKDGDFVSEIHHR